MAITAPGGGPSRVRAASGTAVGYKVAVGAGVLVAVGTGVGVPVATGGWVESPSGWAAIGVGDAPLEFNEAGVDAGSKL